MAAGVAVIRGTSEGGPAVVVLRRTCTGLARGTSADPKSATEPAGHWPAAVGGRLRMTCRVIGDPSCRDGGKLAGADSGPSGAM